MGYFGYEALDGSTDSLDEKIFPNIAVGFYDWAVIVDHEKRESWIVYDKKNILIDYLSTKFLSKNLSIKQDYNNIFYNFEKNISKEKYMADVKTIKSYIRTVIVIRLITLKISHVNMMLNPGIFIKI